MSTLKTRRVVGSAFALFAAALCAGHVACSREPTALVIAVDTDMGVSDDLDELGLYVGVAGEVKTSLRVPTSVNEPAKLPGTLSILQPSDESTPIHVRIAGYKNGQLRVVRDAISTVPSGQLSLVRMPLHWLAATHVSASTSAPLSSATQSAKPGQVKLRAIPNDDTTFSEFAPFFPGYVSPCPQGQTSDQGQCINAIPAEVTKVSSGDMVREVYGGALGLDPKTGIAEGGTCFDVESCFANEQTLLEADYVGCKVTLPPALAQTQTVNFALVRNEASQCKGKGCFVPLDWDGRYDAPSRSFTFPPEVCKRLTGTDAKTKVERIAVATTCDAKLRARPRCNGLFGAVRDKAPSDPTRAPYYSQGPGPNPITDGGPLPPDARAPDGAPLGPPPPTLLAKLVQVSNPRRLAIANDRVWVRGAIGLAFLDARGPSAPTEIGQLPNIQGINLDDGNSATSLVAFGNTSCVANTISTARTGGYWCYDLTIPGRAEIEPDGLTGLLATDSQASIIANDRSPFFVYPGTVVSGAIGPIGTSDRLAGSATGPSKQAVLAFNSATGFLGLKMTTAPYSSADMTLTFLATIPEDFREPNPGAFVIPPKRIDITSNATEVFFAVGARVAPRAAIFRKKYSEAGPTPGTTFTEANVPSPQNQAGTTLAADSNYVYWGGGAAGPMAMSTCTTKPVAPKALFPTAGAQDNTTFAVAKAGAKLYFATNDGRVYSMDPPAAEACP